MDCQFSPSHLAGRTVPPASKSETHRRLICAGLSRETSTLEGLTASQDTVATMRCLRALGADISGTEGTVTVRGFARSFVREKFPLGRGEVVQNTGRFTLSRLWDVVAHLSTRSMQTLGVVYPYWENAARGAEDT